MPKSTARKVFINLPVRDLPRAKAFFSALGFGYNEKFTDDKAACMVISEEAYVMLLSEPFFKTFTKQEVCDTSRQTETLLALSCESRSEVDELAAAGAGLRVHVHEDLLRSRRSSLGAVLDGPQGRGSGSAGIRGLAAEVAEST
jgi:predicted lactoylglutathione lyase